MCRKIYQLIFFNVFKYTCSKETDNKILLSLYWIAALTLNLLSFQTKFIKLGCYTTNSQPSALYVRDNRELLRKRWSCQSMSRLKIRLCIDFFIEVNLSSSDHIEAEMASSSFHRKAKRRAPGVPGVFPSLLTTQLLTSSGIPDLDALLGGGLVIGSVLVIVEDVSANFSRLALKYFLSEGVANKHALLVTHSCSDWKLITQSLPAFEIWEPGVVENENRGSDEKMIIAWRYQGQTSTKECGLNLSNMGKRTHSFNMLKTIPSETLSQSDITSCDIDSTGDNGKWGNSAYFKVIQDIQSKVKEGGFLIDSSASEIPGNILRIGVPSLGLSIWSDLEHRRKHLRRFLYCLRATLRSCFGVAVVTLPSSFFRN